MTVVLQSALVRVWDRHNQIIGAGFLVTESHILTCAHVVSDALDLPRQEMPANPVQLDFPFIAPGQKVTAVVTLWQPKRPDGTGDIAGLELQASPPDGARPLRLVSTPDTWNHPFRAFGFPIGRDNGVYASGVMRDRTVNGHIQIEDVKTPGYSVEPGFSGAPVWDEILHGVIGMAATAESKTATKAAFIIPTDKLVEVWPDLRTWAMPPNPYRGLQAFRQEDADLFFGRETFVGQLATAVAHKPFVAVIGASGSGKSSVVFAGLLPKVGRETAVVQFRPGSQPFRALADALLLIWQPELVGNKRLEEAEDLVANLQTGKTQLLNVVNDILQRQSMWKRLLLVADQFEELYTLCPQPEMKRAFVRCLVTAVQAQAGQHSPTFTLLLTMRADFMGQATEERPLADTLQDATHILGPMTREELAAAVEKPAQAASVQFEPGLIARILDDVGDEPGNLPLLEFALTLLWDKQTNGLLTHADYEAIGAVEGALARYAEEQFASLTESEQAQSRLIFTQLVQPGRGAEDTRRQATMTEIGAENWVLVKWLADARLVVTNRNEAGEETAEIVHEVLTRRWQRLREWMNQDRRFREWQERLREAIRQWQTANEDESALLRGTLLAEAEGWMTERDSAIQRPEQAFIKKSVVLRERTHLIQVRRRNVVLAISLLATSLFAVLGLFSYEQSQDLAVEGTRAAANEGTAVAESTRAFQNEGTAVAESTRAFQSEGTAVAESTRAFANEGTAIAERATAQAEAIRADQNLATAVYNEQLALEREVEAEWQRRVALVQSLAALSAVTYERDHNPELAILLGIEAAQLNKSSQTGANLLVDNSLRSILQEYGYYPDTLTGHAAAVLSVAFAPDRQVLAIGSADGTIRLRNLGNPTEEPVVLVGHKNPVVSVAFTLDGRTLASGSADGTVRLWDMANLWDMDNRMAEPLVLTGHEDKVLSVAFASDGQTLASGSAAGTVRLWDMANLWDMDNRMAEPLVLTGHEDKVLSVAFSPNGQTLASGSADDKVRLWNMNDLVAEPVVLVGHESSVWSVAFALGGQMLASGSGDHTIRLWNIGSLADEPMILIGHQSAVLSVAFAPDGPTLASGSDDGTIRLWDMGSPAARPVVLLGYEDTVLSVAFALDGQTLASGGLDGTVRMWNMVNNPVAQPLVLIGHEEWVFSVAFAPVGQTLASGGLDGTIRVWDMGNPTAEPRILIGHDDSVVSVAFAPDGQTLASGSYDGTIRLWNMGTPTAEPLVLTEQELLVESVAFPQVGKMFASASVDGTIRLWDMGNPTAEPLVLTGTEGLAYSLAFAPNGQMLASGSHDGTIRLWDMGNPTAEPVVLSRHKNWVVSVAFAPDGKTLASGGVDGTVRIWDMDNPTAEPVLLTGHRGMVLSVAFAPDGQTLASSGEDDTIRLWDVGYPTAEPVVLSGHKDWVVSVAFAPDGQRLASGSRDRTIRLWLTLKGLVDFGCQTVGRNLNWLEWQRYLPGEPYRQTCPNLPIHPSVPQGQQ